MKKYLTILLLLIFSIYTAKPSCQEERLRIYLCSRLTDDAKQWNDVVSAELETEFILFRPQDIDLDSFSVRAMDYAIYQADFMGMNQSDLLLVLPPYGRDCAWEIGWFCGKERPAIAYVEANEEWLRDAMVKGGLTAIVTNDPIIHNLLLNDPATTTKSHLITSQKDLGRIIKQIYDETIKKGPGL